MIAPLLTLLLAAKLVAHSGKVLTTGGSRSSIGVYDCRGDPVQAWIDPRGVVVMGPWPYQTDTFGEYQFFTQSPYVVLTITTAEDPASIVIVRTCPEPERTHR